MSSIDLPNFESPDLWGLSTTFPLKPMWLVLTSIYHGSPIWRQVPMRVDEDAPVPSEFGVEVSQLTQEVMQGLKAKLEQQGDRWDLESLFLHNSLWNPNGPLLEQCVPTGDRYRLSSVLMEELADRFAPDVCRKVLEGLKQSLSIEFEVVPFNFLPPGKREETLVTRQEQVPNPATARPVTGPAPMLTRTVLGRAIWRPSLVPFVVPKAWIPDVLARRDHLAFQAVDPEKSQEPQTCLLEPVPWRRWDLLNPMVEPLAVLPLSLVGWPPQKERLAEAAKAFPDGSLASVNLGIMAENLKGQGWFTLCDLLDPPPPKPGDGSTTGG